MAKKASQGLSGLPPSVCTSPPESKAKRILLHAEQKWGKTSFAAMADKALFMMTKGEDGLITLMDAGVVPRTPFITSSPNGLDQQPTIDTWEDAKLKLSELIVYDDLDIANFVIDTFNGLVQLMSKSVCDRHYDGDFEKFNYYLAGDRRLAQNEMQDLLGLLDRLRHKHNMNIFLLMHSQVKMCSEPGHDSYDRWEIALPKFTKAIVDRWVDAILFGGYRTFVTLKNKKDQKGKAEGGTQRVLYTTRTAAFDAGNRLGLEGEIDCGDTPEETFTNFVTAVKEAKNNGTKI